MRHLLLIFMLALGIGLSTPDSSVSATETSPQFTIAIATASAPFQTAQASLPEIKSDLPDKGEGASSSFSIRDNGLLVLLLFILAGALAIAAVRFTQKHRRPL